MTPATYNITIYKGVTFGPIVIACKDDAGADFDLTGYSAWAEVRKNPSGAVLLDLNASITDAAGGEITIQASDTETASLTAGTNQWDLILEDDSGARLGPFIVGTATFAEPITQP